MRFVPPQQAKKKIKWTAEVIRRLYALGWISHATTVGKRAQIHVPRLDCIQCFTTTGHLHAKQPPEKVDEALHEWFGPPQGCLASILDCEWNAADSKLFIFDAIKLDGKSLRDLTFEQRHALLFRDFIHPNIKVLPIIKSPTQAIKVLQGADPTIQGLIFRSSISTGWPASGILRCPK